MDTKRLTNELKWAQLALIKKLGVHPNGVVRLVLFQTGQWYAHCNMSTEFGAIASDGFDCPFAALKDIRTKIDAIPNLEPVHRRELRKRIHEAIDYAQENGIEGEFIAPLYKSSRMLLSTASTEAEGL